MESRPDRSSLLVLIPAYNAGRHIDELVQRLRLQTGSAALLFVDDGSTDDTAARLAALSVTTISHRANRGKGAALKTGFRYAVDHDYQTVLTMDADLQHLPEETAGFLCQDDPEAVAIGRRKRDAGMPAARRFSNLLTSLVVSILGGRRVSDSQCGFRLLPTALLRRLDLKSDGFGLESELLFRACRLRWPMHEVDVSTVYDGSSSRISHVGETLRFIGLTMRRLFW